MKRSLKKILTITTAAVLILAVAAAVIIDLLGGWILKTAIETAATKTLNVGVSIGSIDLSVLGGAIEIEDLSVNNPPGYQYEKLLELKKAGIAVDLKSLLSSIVKIKEIRFDGVNIVLEQRGISGNNLQDITSSINARGRTKKEKPQQAETAGKKLHINNLEISDVTVKAKLLPVPGKSDTVTLKLAPIKMTDLGGDNKMDTAELSGKILLALAEGIAKEGTGILPGDLTDTMKSTLDEAKKLGESAAEEGKKLLEKGKDITEGLKELFKQKDK